MPALGALSTLAELGKHKASFASATEPELDYSTAAGKAFLGMLFVFNQFIRDSLTESWATTAEHAIARGIHISPVDYFGYDLGQDRLNQIASRAGISPMMASVALSTILPVLVDRLTPHGKLPQAA